MKIPTYSSFLDKDQHFQENQKIDNKDDFDLLYKSLRESSQQRYIFRGMGEAKYKLFTSLQRYYIESRIPSAMSMQDFIQKEISNIDKDPLCEYYRRLNVKTSDYLFLSFLQHYGAPTPLLDFSHNINVALYFATEQLNYGQGSNDIDDYFSLYYICIDDSIATSDNNLPNLATLLKDKYISSIESNLNQDNRDNIELTFSKLSSIHEYLSLSKVHDSHEVAYIANILQNYTLYGIPEDIEIWKLAEKVRAYRNACRKGKNYEEKKNEIERIVQIFFEKYTQITNLNLVAQEGCFLIHNSNSDNPIEEVLNGSAIINCINIHKSLGEYVLKKCEKTKDKIYPNPIKMANESHMKILRNL